jgi:hypothetical protein
VDETFNVAVGLADKIGTLAMSLVIIISLVTRKVIPFGTYQEKIDEVAELKETVRLLLAGFSKTADTVSAAAVTAATTAQQPNPLVTLSPTEREDLNAFIEWRRSQEGRGLP